MVTPDGREIVFAGAGIIWGATTFFRGFNHWKDVRKTTSYPPPSSLIVGFVLILACSGYLTWSLFNFYR